MLLGFKQHSFDETYTVFHLIVFIGVIIPFEVRGISLREMETVTYLMNLVYYISEECVFSYCVKNIKNIIYYFNCEKVIVEIVAEFNDWGINLEQFLNTSRFLIFFNCNLKSGFLNMISTTN